MNLDDRIIVIEGDNGSGKTSLLEAIHYLCYMRSFRTHIPRDLVNFEKDSFFVKAQLSVDDAPAEIQVGFSGARRLVKFNQRPIQSFKDLVPHYRVVTLIEDDLMLIKGGPEIRRAFIDQALILSNPDYLLSLKSYRAAVDHRNTVLTQSHVADDTYRFWTKHLWEQGITLQKQRRDLLANLEQRVNILFKEHFSEQSPLDITLEYRSRKHADDESFDTFLQVYGDLLKQEELRLGRSMFGAHLDDFAIHFRSKKSKLYASRGQQKLIMLLLKIAHVQEIIEQHGPIIFLLDDLMADFDTATLERLVAMLINLNCQLIFTIPTQPSQLKDLLTIQGAVIMKLTDGNICSAAGDF